MGTQSVEGSPSAFLTDLYELTMAAAYFENDMTAPATFELSVRTLPANRGYLLAAGLEQALLFLENLTFSSEQIEFLRRHPSFAHVGDTFFKFLSTFRFQGEVWAVPEGTPVFALEPLLRVTAPIIEAQIVETFLLTTLSFQTLVATKAARLIESAAGRDVVEFGSRRAHGPEAGVLAARAAYIGGCVGTSNVEAHHRFGVPSMGTVGHSFVMAHSDEQQSFRDVSRIFREDAVLLLDTYDTLAAVDKLIAAGLRPSGVRLDSGDRLALSKKVRRRLDRAGLSNTKIFVSGDLDEETIAKLLAGGAPIDAFGVGTALATSVDVPALSSVYKLVEYAGQPRVKLSEAKPSFPGKKQVFRSQEDGRYNMDVIACAEETMAGEPLLECVMRMGKRIFPALRLEEVRKYARRSILTLPPEVRVLNNPAPLPVCMSHKLRQLFVALSATHIQPNRRAS